MPKNSSPIVSLYYFCGKEKTSTHKRLDSILNSRKADNKSSSKMDYSYFEN
jgi:DNA polymerase III delta subunit